jgi:ketosteroid isomerase-like protein
MTEERLAEFMECWNTRDVDKLVGFFTEDGVFHGSVGPDLLGTTAVGPDAIRAAITGLFERSPGGRFEDTSVYVAGDRGVAEWTFVAGGTAVRGCDLFEFAGDRIRVKNAFRKAHPA